MEEIAPADKLNIVKTFECGQCFRWNADSEGVYFGVASGYPARVWEESGAVFVESNAPEGFWHNYFDLDTDYEAASSSFNSVPYMNICTEYGKGIRILRQDSWEALCSFIISQCNNIKRIKGIVETLCTRFGDRIETEGIQCYSFPSAKKMAGLKEDDLSCLHAGYRVPYIINAARAVDSGEIDLEALKKLIAIRQRMLFLPFRE
jgi:3-methyladenine DNA glycosylase/8-oxoguanine DNA glycosylase